MNDILPILRKRNSVSQNSPDKEKGTIIPEIIKMETPQVESPKVENPFDTHFTFQMNIRKNRKHNITSDEEELLSNTKRLRKASAEVFKEIEEIEAGPQTANSIERIFRQKMQHYEQMQEQLNHLMKLNEFAHDNNDNDLDAYRSVVLDLSMLRKVLTDDQLNLANKKEDVDAFRTESISISKEQHQIMASLILTTFVGEKCRQKHGPFMLKMEWKNSENRKVTWKSHLAVEYEGSYYPQGSDSPSLVAEILDAKFDHGDHLWEPLLGKPVNHQLIKSAHIVTRSSRVAFIRALFNVPDHEAFLMSASNGLIMLACIEEAFDRGECIIVPAFPKKKGTQGEGSGPIELKCLVLNPKLRDGKQFLHQSPDRPGKTMYWCDLHGKFLKFPKECSRRPNRRCLFLHALGAVLDCQLLKIKGWEAIWEEFFNGDLWATPEKYLRNSIMKQTWDMLSTKPWPVGFNRYLFDQMGRMDEDQDKTDSHMFAIARSNALLKHKLLHARRAGESEEEEEEENEDDEAESASSDE